MDWAHLTKKQKKKIVIKISIDTTADNESLTDNIEVLQTTQQNEFLINKLRPCHINNIFTKKVNWFWFIASGGGGDGGLPNDSQLQIIVIMGVVTKI